MAESMVLLPGLLCDATVWAPQVARFGAERPVVTIRYDDTDSLTLMSDIVLQRAPRRFALVGHSMGARVALEVLRKAPERVSRLALLDTGVHGVRPGERDKRTELLEVGRRHGIERLVDVWLPPMVQARRREDPAFMSPLRTMAMAFGVDGYERQMHALLGRREAASLLPMLRCPVLVGVGDQDGWSPPDQHKEIASAVPRATCVVFSDCGHMAPLEAPGAVNRALAEWLKRES